MKLSNHKRRLTQIKNATHFPHLCKFCDTRKKQDIRYLDTGGGFGYLNQLCS